MTSKYTDENPGSIDPDALRQAEDVIEQLRWTYIREWAPAAMSEIEGAVQGVNTSLKSGLPCREFLDVIIHLTHDMKGQAGTFGLELLMDFAASLNAFVMSHESIDLAAAEVIQAHATAMRQVIADVSVSPDGAVTAEMAEALSHDLRVLAQMRFN